MKKQILTILFALMLVGCASSSGDKPSINYYLLDEAQTLPLARNTQRSIAVNQVVMPEYLSLPNLILKGLDHRITLANYHFWAEPLGPSIKRAIMSDLSMLNPTIAFVDSCLVCDSISVSVDHFYPEEVGDVVFTGSYVIKRVNGNLENHSFSLRSPLVANGYPAAVEEMREQVKILAHDITQELKLKIILQ